MKPILSIQYLRAIAVLGVVAFHQLESTPHPFSVGASGVDLFFVISGFIMFIVTENSESRPGIFFWRRLIRIVPLYWCVTLLTIAVFLIQPGLLWNVSISFQHVLTSLLFIPHAEIAGSLNIMPTFPQGWSLNLEMFFYVLTALSLFCPRRLQLPLLTALFLGCAATGALMHFRSAIPRAYTSHRLLELVAGLWLGKFWTQGVLPSRRMGAFLLAAGITGFVLQQMLNIRAEDFLPNVPAILLVAGALSVEANGGIVSLRLLKLLGDASYSIYLLNPLVVACVALLDLPYLLALFTGMTASALAGVLVFLWCERPLNATLRRISPWHFLFRTKKDLNDVERSLNKQGLAERE